MKTIQVPTRDTVSEANQELFDALHGKLGKVPNLYAAFAHSEHALGTFLALQSAKSSLTAKEREAVNLVVSQVNECSYCLAAHTAISGMMKWYTEDQVMDLRGARAPWDTKLDALARLAERITLDRGKPAPEAVDRFFDAGYTTEHLIDLCVAVGDKVIANYVHGVTQVPVDWPAAAPLEASVAAV